MRRATLSITSLIASFRIRTPKRPAAACEERLEIGGRSLPLVIVRSPRARRAALRVDATRGEIRLTLPTRVAEARARRLIETHRDWIADRVARSEEHPSELQPLMRISY